MGTLLSLVLLAVGFVFLVKGADWLVEGGSGLARRFGVSPLIIGLTVLAFGTSLPEFTVNMLAAFTGKVDIAIGNIVGSNIANIGLILGVTGLFYTLHANPLLIKRDAPYYLFCALLLLILSCDHFFVPGAQDTLSREDGLLFALMFVSFIYLLFVSSPESEFLPKIKKHSIWILLIFIALGLIGVSAGGELIVYSASDLARRVGVSEYLIGLTIVSIGTSLPEFATSFVAAKKGETDLAIGNIIGSNIFNTVFILGISATIMPLPLSSTGYVDVLVMLGFGVLLYVLMFIRKTISRLDSAIMLTCYLAYLGFLAWRG